MVVWRGVSDGGDATGVRIGGLMRWRADDWLWWLCEAGCGTVIYDIGGIVESVI